MFMNNKKKSRVLGNKFRILGNKSRILREKSWILEKKNLGFWERNPWTFPMVENFFVKSRG
jgi:hypothetical protein